MPEDTATRPEITVTIEGKQHTVPAPEGWMPEAEVKENFMPKDQFAQELEKRAKAKTKGLVKPDDLLTDEEFLTRVVGHEENKNRIFALLGIKPGEGPKDVDVAELRRKIETDVTARFEEQRVKPMQKQVESLETLVGLLRERDWRAEFITAAADIGLQDEMAEPLAAFFRKQFRFDEEADGWYKVGEDGELEINIRPEPNGSRYVTVAHVLTEHRRDGKHQTWFKPPTGGAGYQGGRGSGKSRVTYDQFKAMSDVQRAQLRADDPDTWKQFMAQVEEEGSSKLFAQR